MMRLRQSKKHKKKNVHTELDMPNPIITLTTDFGLRDPYVARAGNGAEHFNTKVGDEVTLYHS